MFKPVPSFTACLLLTLFMPLGTRAQTSGSPEPASATQAQGMAGRTNQTIERIRVEDKGSRIDELRVGGQTQSISVQPKNDMPAYEIRPADPQGSQSSGHRVWTFGRF